MKLRDADFPRLPFALVDGEDHGAAGLAHPARRRFIGRAESLAGVGQQDGEIALGQRPFELPAKRLVPIAALAYARRIDKDYAPAVQPGQAVAAVARQTGIIGDQGFAFTGKPVEERGFAYVGPPGKGHDR